MPDLLSATGGVIDQLPTAEPEAYVIVVPLSVNGAHPAIIGVYDNLVSAEQAASNYPDAFVTAIIADSQEDPQVVAERITSLKASYTILDR